MQVSGYITNNDIFFVAKQRHGWSAMMSLSEQAWRTQSAQIRKRDAMAPHNGATQWRRYKTSSPRSPIRREHSLSSSLKAARREYSPREEYVPGLGLARAREAPRREAPRREEAKCAFETALEEPQEETRVAVGVESLDRGSFMPISLKWMLIDDHKAVVEQMDQEMRAMRAELENAVRSLEAELSRAKPLRLELEAANNERRRLQTKLDAVAASAHLDGLKMSAELESHRTALATSARSIAALESERRSLLAGLSHAKDAQQSVTHAFEQAEAEASARRLQQLEQARMYEHARSSASVQRHVLDVELETARSAHKALSTQLDASQADVARLAPALIEQTTLTERLSTDLEGALRVNEGLRDELQQLLASRAASEQQCAVQAAQLADLRARLDDHTVQSHFSLAKCLDERQAYQWRMQELEAAALVARRGTILMDRWLRRRLEEAAATLRSDANQIARPMQWTHTDAERRALLPKLLQQRWTALIADEGSETETKGDNSSLPPPPRPLFRLELAAQRLGLPPLECKPSPSFDPSDDVEAPRHSPPRPWGHRGGGMEEEEEEDTSLTTVDVARLTRQALGKFMEASVFLAQACV